MTDKIQKIREGIEKLKLHLLRGACASQIAMETRCKEEAYNEVLAILDSLQEEPVSNPIDFEQELYKAFGQIKDFTLGIAIAKRFYDMGRKHNEPVSEELEEAAKRYATEGDEISGLYIIDEEADAFKAEAKWQKSEDNNDANHALVEQIKTQQMWYEKGMADMKQQLMVNATKVTVYMDAGGYPYIPQMELYDYDKDVPLAKEDDKYKVILIKEN